MLSLIAMSAQYVMNPLSEIYRTFLIQEERLRKSTKVEGQGQTVDLKNVVVCAKYLMYTDDS